MLTLRGDEPISVVAIGHGAPLCELLWSSVNSGIDGEAILARGDHLPEGYATARFAAGLSDAGFEILNDVVLNQVLVSFGSDAFTPRVIDAVQRSRRSLQAA